MKHYVKTANYKGYSLSESIENIPDADPPVTIHRWDVIDGSGQVICVMTDRVHAESFVDRLNQGSGRNAG